MYAWGVWGCNAFTGFWWKRIAGGSERLTAGSRTDTTHLMERRDLLRVGSLGAAGFEKVGVFVGRVVEALVAESSGFVFRCGQQGDGVGIASHAIASRNRWTAVAGQIVWGVSVPDLD